jgi:hypothetical protein
MWHSAESQLCAIRHSAESRSVGPIGVTGSFRDVTLCVGSFCDGIIFCTYSIHMWIKHIEKTTFIGILFCKAFLY